MSALFSSISSLSTNPTSSSVAPGSADRGAESGHGLQHRIQHLTSQQTGLNTQVTQDVEPDQPAHQADCRAEPADRRTEATGQDGGTLEDQQDQLVLQLSKLTNVSVINANDGITVTTGMERHW